MCCLIDRVHKNNRVKDQIALNSFAKDVALTSFVKASLVFSFSLLFYFAIT